METITKKIILLTLGIILSFSLGFYNASVGIIFIVLLLMLILFMGRGSKDSFHSINYRSFKDFIKNVHSYHYSSYSIYLPLVLITYFISLGFNEFYFWITIIIIILYFFIITLAYFSEKKIKFLDDFLIIGSISKLNSSFLYSDIKKFKIIENNLILFTLTTKIKLKNFTKSQIRNTKNILLSKGVKER